MVKENTLAQSPPSFNLGPKAKQLHPSLGPSRPLQEAGLHQKTQRRPTLYPLRAHPSVLPGLNKYLDQSTILMLATFLII